MSFFLKDFDWWSSPSGSSVAHFQSDVEPWYQQQGAGCARLSFTCRFWVHVPLLLLQPSSFLFCMWPPCSDLSRARGERERRENSPAGINKVSDLCYAQSWQNVSQYRGDSTRCGSGFKIALPWIWNNILVRYETTVTRQNKNKNKARLSSGAATTSLNLDFHMKSLL